MQGCEWEGGCKGECKSVNGRVQGCEWEGGYKGECKDVNETGDGLCEDEDKHQSEDKDGLR